VGNDVAEQFQSLFPEWSPVEGKRRLDLPEANRRQLIASGVPADYIYDCGRCTACEPDVFFSYRREPEITDRMIASICRVS
jgi:copper oxidase (laccase) domain-containing protein